MNNTKLPDQESFVAALCAAHPEYPKAGAVAVYAKIATADADVQEAAMSWIGGGEIPALSAGGHSVAALQKDFGLNGLAALLTIQWLRKDPVAAEKALKAGIK